MNFAVHISAPPFSCQSHITGLLFCEAVARSEHAIERVFFSGDAVAVANRLTVTPQGESDLRQRWIDLAANAGTELILCVSASLQRGMLDQGESERYEKGGYNIAEPFIISGLGQLIESCIVSDRLLTFGQ